MVLLSYYDLNITSFLIINFIIFYSPLALIQGIIFSNGKVEVIIHRAAQMDVPINIKILNFFIIFKKYFFNLGY